MLLPLNLLNEFLVYHTEGEVLTENSLPTRESSLDLEDPRDKTHTRPANSQTSPPSRIPVKESGVSRQASEETDERNTTVKRGLKISDRNQDVSRRVSRRSRSNGRREQELEDNENSTSSLANNTKTNGSTLGEALYSSWSEGLSLEGTEDGVLQEDASSSKRKKKPSKTRSRDRSLHPLDSGKKIQLF